MMPYNHFKLSNTVPVQKLECPVRHISHTRNFQVIDTSLSQLGWATDQHQKKGEKRYDRVKKGMISPFFSFFTSSDPSAPLDSCFLELWGLSSETKETMGIRKFLHDHSWQLATQMLSGSGPCLQPPLSLTWQAHGFFRRHSLLDCCHLLC